GKSLEDGQYGLVVGEGGAHDQVQAAFGGFLGGARHGGVQEAATCLFHLGGNPYGRSGNGGRAVDQRGAGAQMLKQTARTEQNGLHVGGARHAKNDQIGRGGHVGDGGDGLRSRAEQRRQRLVARVFENGQWIAVAQQAGGDARPHQAAPDEPYRRFLFFHVGMDE